MQYQRPKPNDDPHFLRYMQCEKGSHSLETKIKSQPYFQNPLARNSLQKKTPVFLKRHPKKRHPQRPWKLTKRRKRYSSWVAHIHPHHQKQDMSSIPGKGDRILAYWATQPHRVAG